MRDGGGLWPVAPAVPLGPLGREWEERSGGRGVGTEAVGPRWGVGPVLGLPFQLGLPSRYGGPAGQH